MALTPLKWEKRWGPKKLQSIVDFLVDAINARAPIPGLGIDIDETPSGRQIKTKDAAPPAATAPTGIPGSSSTGGGPTVIATEYTTSATVLTDGSDEVLYSNEIPANQLKTDGDCIRAVYSVRTQVHDPLSVWVTFGSEVGGGTIADGTLLSISAQGNIRIEILIIRSDATDYRHVSTIVVDEGGDGNSFTICRAGATTDDIFLTFDESQFLVLRAAVGTPDAEVGMIKARMALIEYIPA